ncbi:hypothetical protein L3Q82_005684 [Scortum barcoo]|uniref:Uncharacterized protein n=1 Tax=Scortum barcoo TaxID=214431 RepID=A0ACB8V6I4_9TELE|nr:hypothetical protein L3Q82_005684 [Scortum barcoo]
MEVKVDKNISSLTILRTIQEDEGMYLCGVTDWIQITWSGNYLSLEGNSFWSQEAKIVVFLLCAALAIIPVIAFLIYNPVKKNKSDCYTAVDDQKSHQVRTLKRDEDRQIYSAVLFVMMKTDSGAISDAKAAERERIYAAVKAFGLDHLNKTPRITAKQGKGSFLLHIEKTERSDTGVYYCIKVDRLDMTFLNGAFLRIKGSEPDITTIVQNFPSDPVRPGDSVTLQCSVLSDYENKTCPGQHSVYWFRAGSDGAHPTLIYVQRNNSDQCEKSPEAHSPQKCVYNFSKNVSSSDAGTYHCAVATCGEILFGDGTKLDIQAAASLRTNVAAASSDQRSQQRDEHSLVYSAPNFTKKKTVKVERRNVKTAEGETVYSDVRVL